MTAGSYGQSFAAKHLAEGRVEQALDEADKAIAREPDDPEPVLDRAQILAALGRYEEAVAAVVRCLELDRVARVIDDAFVDDTLFSTLVSWGQRLADSDREQAVAVLRRYLDIFPAGSHISEVATWEQRLRGHRETWAKARPDES